MPFTFSIQSKVNADKQALWQHVTQMQNVNYELLPIVRMTYPADRAALNGADVPLHTPLFTSVLLLFSIIPIDLHHLAFDKIDDGNAFYENSTTLTHKYWKHTRTLTATDGGTWVKDEVTFQPRLPLLGHLFLPVYKQVFAHRHRRLTKLFQY
ncbi:MAG: hypothetical protein JST49_10255 [Bacteroidetes bacterium]|nr:hypothetical protein [Bacteroidota bacterium]